MGDTQYAVRGERKCVKALDCPWLSALEIPG
jgi:hypothetical protein